MAQGAVSAVNASNEDSSRNRVSDHDGQWEDGEVWDDDPLEQDIGERSD